MYGETEIMVKKNQVVLVVGSMNDPTLVYFSQWLNKKKSEKNNAHRWLFVDQTYIIKEEVKVDQSGWHFANQRLAHEEIYSVWNRFNVKATKKIHNKTITSVWYLFDEIYDFVVNRPYACMNNFAKMQQIFAVPCVYLKKPESMLVANIGCEADELLQAMKGKRWIAKSPSIIRSKVDLFEKIKNNHKKKHVTEPVLLQEFIEGKNIRVHVVGDFVWSVIIETKKIDYRYDQSTTMQPFELPKTIKMACLDHAKQMNLSFAGIDLIKRKEEYFLLEINASPGYHYFEGKKAQISKALMLHLTKNKGESMSG